MLTAVIAASSLILGAYSVSAADAALSIERAWARPSASAAIKNGVAYMQITNNTDADDALLSAVAADVADIVEVHEMSFIDGVMRMQEITPLPVPAKQTVYLKPGGYHLMLLGLKKPLIVEEQFPVTLTFEKAGNVDVMVTVLQPPKR